MTNPEPDLDLLRDTAQAAEWGAEDHEPGEVAARVASAGRQRFWSRTLQSDADSCWPWLGPLHPDGYGRCYYDGKTWWAHRLSYEFSKGPIPAGLVIDHLCRNRSCVNPAHLEAVTNQENLRRGKALITSCPSGHEYSDDNTYVSDGKRSCKECHRENERQRRRRGGDKRPCPICGESRAHLRRHLDAMHQEAS